MAARRAFLKPRPFDYIAPRTHDRRRAWRAAQGVLLKGVSAPS